MLLNQERDYMALKGKKVTIDNNKSKSKSNIHINTTAGALSENAVKALEPAEPAEQPKPSAKTKGKPGRPKKTTPKAENRTISTDPILFEKYILISELTNKASLSEFLRQAVECYCEKLSISLYDEKLNEEAKKRYDERLDKKAEKRTISRKS